MVEDIADDACSTRRVNSAWETISMPVINTNRHTYCRFDECLVVALNVDTSLE